MEFMLARPSENKCALKYCGMELFSLFALHLFLLHAAALFILKIGCKINIHNGLYLYFIAVYMG